MGPRIIKEDTNTTVDKLRMPDNDSKHRCELTVN